MALAKWMGLTGPANGSVQNQTLPAVPTSPINGSADYKQFGLENFGNTCYVNSVLQALYFCQPFRELIVRTPDKSNPPVPVNTYTAHPASPTSGRGKNGRKLSSVELSKPSDAGGTYSVPHGAGPPIPTTPPTMFSALRALFLHISDNMNDKGTLSPKAFIDKLKKENEIFRSPTTHQDAHEFLMYLLNKVAEDLEEEARDSRSESAQREEPTILSPTRSSPSTSKSSLPSPGSHSTIVHKLFEGILTSETLCLTCQTVSSRDEEFLDLSIDIEQNTSVTACLKQFSASEMLCQKNKFYCDSCHGLQEAKKRMKIKKLPNILTLHLKRFKYQEEKYIKLLYRVAFPLSLRLFNTMDDADNPDRLYELFAALVHIGTGPNHGHYVTIAKSRGSWVLFDDDIVETIKESDISKYFGEANNCCAYVLYYQAVDLNQTELGLQPKEVFIPETATDSSSSQAPALPPGLTHEGDSDTSDPLPSTPAFSPAIAPAVDGLLSLPPVSIDVPSSPPPHSNTPSSVKTPSIVSPVSKQGGFFNSIRHHSSKHQLSNQSRPSDASPIPPVPLVPSNLASPKMSSAPSEPISQSLARPGEKSDPPRSPRKRTSGWFTRKLGAKADARPATAHEFPTPQFRTNSMPAESSYSSSSSQGFSNSESPSSPALSAIEWSSLVLSPSPIPSSPTGPYSSREGPPVPSSPHFAVPVRSSTSPPPSYRHQTFDSSRKPRHKKSQPSWTEMATPLVTPYATPHTAPHAAPHAISRPEANRKREPLLERPATAGSTPSLGSFIRLEEREAPSVPSVPPLPPELRAYLSRQRANEQRVEPRAEQEPGYVSIEPPPLPTPARRASRKLSFSGGMLSFGRKDKDKHDNIGITSHATSDTTRSLFHNFNYVNRI